MAEGKKKINALQSRMLQEIRDENKELIHAEVEQATEQSRVSLRAELIALIDDTIAELLLGVEPTPDPEPAPEPVEEEPTEEPEPKEPKPERVIHAKTKHR